MRDNMDLGLASVIILSIVAIFMFGMVIEKYALSHKPIPVEAPVTVEAPSMLPYDNPNAYRIVPLSIEGLKCVVVLGPVSGIGGCWPEMEMEEKP